MGKHLLIFHVKDKKVWAENKNEEVDNLRAE